ncbi:MAG: class I adenylate-forming enzyme family protein, partial [Pseudomonadota bacterium]
MRAPYSRTIFELLCEQAERAPNGIAAVHGSRRVTYSELANDAGGLAAGLRDRGIQRADRVGLLSTNSIEWLEIFFATTALGATLVPFSTWSTVRELEFLIEDSRIRTLFLISRFGEQHFAKNLHDMISAGAIPAIKDCCLIDDASMPLMSR